MLHNRSMWKSFVTYAINYNLILWVCLAGNRVGKFVANWNFTLKGMWILQIKLDPMRFK